MNGLAILENINNVIDDDLIVEADLWVRPKAHSLIKIVGIAIVAASLCLTISLSLGLSNKKDPIKTDNSIGCTILPGADEIYPTIMVNGRLYEWKRRRTPTDSYAIIDSLPVGSVYNGEIHHVDGSLPKNDCEFVSVFSANGRIFIDANDDCVYLELTTEWLDRKIVVFEPILRGSC